MAHNSMVDELFEAAAAGDATVVAGLLSARTDPNAPSQDVRELDLPTAN